ncbi:MAG: rhodanese-like domain-containing protein [Gemmatimonadota bacterium]
MQSTGRRGEPRRSEFSFVNEFPPAEPEAARDHFRGRLSMETDPADVHLDLERAPDRILVLDVRSPEAYEACHVPGAVNLPHRTISAKTTASIERGRTLVVYCWGPGCNAAQKGAARLAELGFRVKEMIGGLEYWRREGHDVDGNDGDSAPLHG